MVYVDPILACVPNRHWKWDSSCHLFADTEAELHTFAQSIGLRREWFQDNPRLKHYDLTPARRRDAVRRGAVELDRAAAVAKWRELRTGARSIAPPPIAPVQRTLI